MTNLLLAQLPDPSWLAAGAVAGFLIVAVGAMLFIRAMRELRTNLADELRRELESASAPAQVAVQQPLTVTPADKFVTHVEFAELKVDVEQIREEVKDGFRTLGDERRTSVGNLHGKIDGTNAKVDEMRGEVRLLNQQLQQLLSRQLK